MLEWNFWICFNLNIYIPWSLSVIKQTCIYLSQFNLFISMFDLYHSGSIIWITLNSVTVIYTLQNICNIYYSCIYYNNNNATMPIVFSLLGQECLFWYNGCDHQYATSCQKLKRWMFSPFFQDITVFYPLNTHITCKDFLLNKYYCHIFIFKTLYRKVKYCTKKPQQMMNFN